MLVSNIALQIDMNSRTIPIQSLKPTGFPPLSSRSCCTNSNKPMGVEKVECKGGDKQSTQGSTPRAAANSGVTFTPGKIALCDGLAPCEIFISTIFTWGC